MSTEPNTQRAKEIEPWMELAANDILSGADYQSVRFHAPNAKGEWCWQYRDAECVSHIIAKHAPKPPPETGAVDFKALAYNFEFGYRNRTDDYVENAIRKYYRDAQAPLTARISELEKVVAVLESQKASFFDEYNKFQRRAEAAEARVKEVERTLETVTKGSFEASQAMAAVNAELRARVKELEAKLSSTQSTSLSSPAKLPEPRSPDTGACNPASTSDAGTRTPPADS